MVVLCWLSYSFFLFVSATWVLWLLWFQDRVVLLLLLVRVFYSFSLSLLSVYIGWYYGAGVFGLIWCISLSLSALHCRPFLIIMIIWFRFVHIRNFRKNQGLCCEQSKTGYPLPNHILRLVSPYRPAMTFISSVWSLTSVLLFVGLSEIVNFCFLRVWLSSMFCPYHSFMHMNHQHYIVVGL